MADYYPLIARAIAGLDPSAPGESRRALYERARSALIAQLRSVQPPLERIRDHPRTAVAGRGRPQGRIRGRPARPRGLAARLAAPQRAAATPSAAPMPVRRTGSPAARPAARARPPGRAAVARRPPPRRRRPPAAQSAPRRAAAAPPRPQPPQLPMQDPPLPPTRERPAAPRRGPRQSRAADAAAAGHARLPRHRRRRRRSRPRRGAGQPLGAKNLCQRAVALAGIRPARAEHGKPRRRSRRAVFL